MRPHVIAIDGPAASGKSSTADAVARRLGWVHLDSGALYRALTWVAVYRQAHDSAAIVAAAEQLHTSLVLRRSALEVHIDGIVAIDEAIRSAEVNARVSGVAAMPVVRDWVNARIREAVAQFGPAVIDGRDIGTVVVPDAPLKVYLTASAAARAERRLRQLHGTVDPLLLAGETARLAERDRLDAGRAAAPLRQAGDAVLIDTTAISFERQVDLIVELAGAIPRQG